MKPTKLKNKHNILAVIAFNAPFIVFGLIINYYLIFLPLLFVLIWNTTLLFFRASFVTFILSCFFIFSFNSFANYIAISAFKPESLLVSFLITSLIVFVFNVIFLNFIAAYIDDVEDMAKNEELRFNIVSNFPHLYCKTHLTRTIRKSRLNYHGITCPVGKRCLTNGDILMNVYEVVGVIGKPIEGY